jgi:outer membrane lipoprotein-sorting protein
MRRISLVLAAMMVVTLLLSACGGKKDAAAVVKDLDQVVGKMASYQGTGTMTFHTGQQPQEYQVEVWYQQPSFYRIKLTNEKQDITQIVLRNNDGVFVLTPHLNKSFRFQSNWPENQGQVYLYQSLANSILADKDRQFTADKDAYVFDVEANYQNSALARQKIWLDQKTLKPKHVQVSDANANVMVEVEFSKFEFGTKFDKDSFDMQRNMTSMTMPDAMPTAQQDAQGAAKAGAAGSADAGKSVSGAGTQGKIAGGATSDAGKAAAGGTTGDAGKTAIGAATQGAAVGGATGGAGKAANGTAAQGQGANGKAASGTTAQGQGTAAGGVASGTAAQGQAQGVAANGAGKTAASGTSAQDQGTATAGSSAGAAAAATGAQNSASGAAKGTAGAQGTAAAGGKAQAPAAAGQAQKQPSATAASKDLDFGIITPGYTPTGVKQKETSQITLGDEKALLLRFAGTYNYNLVELKPEARETYLVPGDIVDLGYTIAVLSGDQKKTLIWTYEGVEYRLSTADLPDDELVHIAQSVQGQLGK